MDKYHKTGYPAVARHGFIRQYSCRFQVISEPKLITRCQIKQKLRLSYLKNCLLFPLLVIKVPGTRTHLSRALTRVGAIVNGHRGVQWDLA